MCVYDKEDVCVDKEEKMARKCVCLPVGVKEQHTDDR